MIISKKIVMIGNSQGIILDKPVLKKLELIMHKLRTCSRTEAEKNHICKCQSKFIFEPQLTIIN